MAKHVETLQSEDPHSEAERVITPHDALEAYLSRKDELLWGTTETGLVIMERTPDTMFFVGYNADNSVHVTFFGSRRQTQYHLFGTNGVRKFVKHAGQDSRDIPVGEKEPRMLKEMIDGAQCRTVMPWLSA